MDNENIRESYEAIIDAANQVIEVFKDYAYNKDVKECEEELPEEKLELIADFFRGIIFYSKYRIQFSKIQQKDIESKILECNPTLEICEFKHETGIPIKGKD